MAFRMCTSAEFEHRSANRLTSLGMGMVYTPTGSDNMTEDIIRCKI